MLSLPTRPIDSRPGSHLELHGQEMTLEQPTVALERPSLSGRHLRDFGRVLGYLIALSALLLVAMRGGRLVGAAALLAVYVFAAIVASNLLWKRTPWPMPPPLLAVTAFWIFSYGIAALPKFSGWRPLHNALAGHEQYLYWALLLVILGNALLAAGFFLVWPSDLDPRRTRPSRLAGRLSLLVAIAVAGVAILSKLYLVSIGRFGYLADFSRGGSVFRQTFTYASEFAWVVLAALAVEIAVTREGPRRNKYVAVFCAVSLVEILWVVVMGFKGYVIHTFMPAIFCLWGLRRRLPVRAVVAGAILLVLISPGNYAYRDALNSGKASRDDFVGAGSAALGYTVRAWSDDPAQNFGRLWESFTFEQADNLENAALIVYKTPSLVPYRGVEQYVMAIPKALFPRFVWQDKPVDDMAAYMTVVYRERPPTTGSPPGFVGELYMSGGLAMVVAGCLVAGALWGLVVRLFSRAPRKDLFVAGSSVIAATFSNTELDSMLTFIVHRSLLYLPVCWLLFYTGRKTISHEGATEFVVERAVGSLAGPAMGSNLRPR